MEGRNTERKKKLRSVRRPSTFCSYYTRTTIFIYLTHKLHTHTHTNTRLLAITYISLLSTRFTFTDQSEKLLLPFLVWFVIGSIYALSHLLCPSLLTTKSILSFYSFLRTFLRRATLTVASTSPGALSLSHISNLTVVPCSIVNFRPSYNVFLCLSLSSLYPRHIQFYSFKTFNTTIENRPSICICHLYTRAYTHSHSHSHTNTHASVD